MTCSIMFYDMLGVFWGCCGGVLEVCCGCFGGVLGTVFLKVFRLIGFSLCIKEGGHGNTQRDRAKGPAARRSQRQSRNLETRKQGKSQLFERSSSF